MINCEVYEAPVRVGGRLEWGKTDGRVINIRGITFS